MDKEKQKRLYLDCQKVVADWLSGKKLTKIECRGELYSFYLEDIGLHLFSQWRLYSAEHIFAKQYEIDPLQVEEQLKLEKVISALMFGVWNDLRITFNNGWVFETFQDSLEYENWNLVVTDIKNFRQMLVAGIGSELALWE